MKLALSSRHNKSDACKVANKGEQISSKNYPISIGRQAQSSELSVATEVGFGRVGSVTHPEEPSRKDHSYLAVTRFAGTPVLDLTDNECLPLLTSLFFTKLWLQNWRMHLLLLYSGRGRQQHSHQFLMLGTVFSMPVELIQQETELLRPVKEHC
jgi:hypothetical protein